MRGAVDGGGEGGKSGRKGISLREGPHPLSPKKNRRGPVPSRGKNDLILRDGRKGRGEEEDTVRLNIR